VSRKEFALRGVIRTRWNGRNCLDGFPSFRRALLHAAKAGEISAAKSANPGAKRCVGAGISDAVVSQGDPQRSQSLFADQNPIRDSAREGVLLEQFDSAVVIPAHRPSLAGWQESAVAGFGDPALGGA
jgi:hypothetical protein